MEEKKLIKNYFFNRRSKLQFSLFFLIIFFLSLACGLSAAFLTKRERFRSSGNISIRKVAEYQLVLTLKNYFYDEELLTYCCEELANKNLTKTNNEPYTVYDLKNSVKANTLMSEYKIIVSFVSDSSEMVKEKATTIIEAGVTYLRQKESHYNNNIVEFNINDDIVVEQTYFIYKIVLTVFVSLCFALAGSLLVKHYQII